MLKTGTVGAPPSSGASFTTKRTYYDKEHTLPGGQAQMTKACKKWQEFTTAGQGFAGKEITGHVSSPDGSGYCTTEEDGSIHSIGTTNEFDTEPECDLIPDLGPYRDLEMEFPPPSSGRKPGAVFTTTQRNNIRFENESVYGLLFSNYSYDIGGFVEELSLTPSIFQLDDDLEAYPQPLASYPPAYWHKAAQVDHIIPRIDVHGCACGTNSYANAAVISAVLNNYMSNDMKHSARRVMLCKYTNLRNDPIKCPYN